MTTQKPTAKTTTKKTTTAKKKNTIQYLYNCLDFFFLKCSAFLLFVILSVHFQRLGGLPYATFIVVALIFLNFLLLQPLAEPLDY